MTVEEMIHHLNVAPGDFVTLDHEQATQCREAFLLNAQLQANLDGEFGVGLPDAEKR